MIIEENTAKNSDAKVIRVFLIPRFTALTTSIIIMSAAISNTATEIKLNVIFSLLTNSTL